MSGEECFDRLLYSSGKPGTPFEIVMVERLDSALDSMHNDIMYVLNYKRRNFDERFDRECTIIQ